MSVILLFLVLRSVLSAGCRPPPSKSNTGVNHLLAGKTPSSRPDPHLFFIFVEFVKGNALDLKEYSGVFEAGLYDSK